MRSSSLACWALRAQKKHTSGKEVDAWNRTKWSFVSRKSTWSCWVMIGIDVRQSEIPVKLQLVSTATMMDTGITYWGCGTNRSSDLFLRFNLPFSQQKAPKEKRARILTARMNRAGIRSLEELKAKLDAHGEAKQRSLGRTSKEGLTPDDVLTFLDTWHWSFSSGWLLSTKIRKRFGESKQSQPRVKGSALIDTLEMTVLYNFRRIHRQTDAKLNFDTLPFALFLQLDRTNAVNATDHWSTELL